MGLADFEEFEHGDLFEYERSIPDYHESVGGYKTSGTMQRLNYEIGGRVQKVYFRKYTLRKARLLHLVGWVKNSSRGTVVGVAEGKRRHINKFRVWLSTKGSPKSHIQRTKFDMEPITKRSFTKFQICY